MDTYKISDLYIAAYLKALWYKCDIEANGKRCFFIFNEEVKPLVGDFVQSSSIEQHNVNASVFVNEIKQLKAYVNNI
jgi:hypothetical protein